MTNDINNQQILHRGKIIECNSEKGHVRLQIEDSHDCGSCPAAKLCNHGSSEKNILTIKTDENFKVGEQVEVVATELMHRKAILLAVVYPCIILIVAMTLTFLLTQSESTAALVGLLLMISFFVVLYLVRNKIAREFTFRISKKL